jgi:hypothetical protein
MRRTAGLDVLRRAEDEARLDAGRGDALRGRPLDDLDRAVRGQGPLRMLQRREANLRVDDPVTKELVEQILDDDAQTPLVLLQ